MEEGILHMVNADPARTPTFAMFAKPDYFLQHRAPPPCSGRASPRTPASPGITVTTRPRSTPTGWPLPGLASPTSAWTAHRPTPGPSSAGPDSGQVTVPGSGTKGTWIDLTDVRPTLMYLTGLKDDYEHDGRVITQLLTRPNAALRAPGVTALGACYKQLNSSVGEFGTATLQAATAAIESTSPGDTTYTRTDQALSGLERVRDGLAGKIKAELEAAAFSNAPVHGAFVQTAACRAVIASAQHLAAAS